MSALPDGFYELNVNGTDSRMWMGPDELVVHAFPRPHFWEVHFVGGDTTTVDHIASTDELEARVVEFCQSLASAVTA